MEFVTSMSVLVALGGFSPIVQSQPPENGPPGAPANPQDVGIVFSRGSDASLTKEGFLRQGSASLELFPQQVSQPREWADLFSRGPRSGSIPTFDHVDRPPSPSRQRVRGGIRNVNGGQRSPNERRAPLRINERRHIPQVNEPPHISPVNERKRNPHTTHANKPPRIPSVDDRRRNPHMPNVNRPPHVNRLNERRRNRHISHMNKPIQHVNKPSHIPNRNEKRRDQHIPHVKKPPHIPSRNEGRHRSHINGKNVAGQTITRTILTGNTPPSKNERRNIVRKVTKVHQTHAHAAHKSPAKAERGHSVPEGTKIGPLAALVDKLTHVVQHLTGTPHPHDHKPISVQTHSKNFYGNPIPPTNPNYRKNRIFIGYRLNEELFDD